MIRLYFYIILLFFSSCRIIGGQQETSTRVVLDVLLNDVHKNDEIYISCNNVKTIFNDLNLEEKTGVQIDSKSLNELIEDSFKQKEINNWKRDDFLNYKSFYKCINLKRIYSNHCKKDIMMISNPIYDKKFNFSILSIVIKRKNGSSNGYSCLFQKTNNKWVLRAKFDLWQS